MQHGQRDFVSSQVLLSFLSECNLPGVLFQGLVQSRRRLLNMLRIVLCCFRQQIVAPLRDQRIDLGHTRLGDRKLSLYSSVIVQRDGDTNILDRRLDRIERIARQRRLDGRRHESCAAIEKREGEQYRGESGNTSQLTRTA